MDKRADIWAFGALLFELLTGRRAFEGETVSDTLAAVLTRDPDWAALPAATPESVRRLLRRCLDRDVRRRLHDIADARFDLDETPATGAATATSPAASGGRFTPALLGVVGLALLAAFLLGSGTSGFSSVPRAGSFPVHATIALPKGQHLAAWASPELAFSPDGRRLAFVAESDAGLQQLFVEHLDRGEMQEVPDSENAEGPFFSPDGQWVGFAVDVSGRSGRPGQLEKFSLASGLTQSVCGIPDYFGGGWRDDGTIFFVGGMQDGLFKVRAEGGTPEPAVAKVRLAGKEVVRSVVWPQVLPGGASILLTDGDASVPGDAAILDLVTGELKDLGFHASFSRYSPTGHLLYVATDGTLLAVAFDTSHAAAVGAPVAILRDLAPAEPDAELVRRAQASRTDDAPEMTFALPARGTAPIRIHIGAVPAV